MTVTENLQHVRDELAMACQSVCLSPEAVQLLAVSKRHNCEKIREAYSNGQHDFGENYLNEALAKQSELADLAIVWHFIGHIQSNKTRKIAENFAWTHAVDSVKIAQRLSDQRPDDLPPLNICLQINIDGEESKSGFSPNADALLMIARQIEALPNVALRGLMCIPAPKNDKVAERETFAKMRVLLETLNAENLSLDTLSMGMSGDLNSAIAEGATMIRVGTAIFGVRNEDNHRKKDVN